MQLWSADVEAMRPEAQRVTELMVPIVSELLDVGRPLDVEGDLTEQAHLQREAFSALASPVADLAEELVGGVRCRIFRPDEAARVVYVHLHGGGMIAGAPAMADLANRDLGMRLGANVVSVDYRLAPEHAHPAAVDDTLDVIVAILDDGGEDLGADTVVIGGESAGAYLAAAAILRLRDDFGAADRIAGLELAYGIYDWGRSPSQRGVRPSTSPDLLAPEGLAFSAACFLPGRTDDERREPSISPAYADLRDLPPAFFSVGTADHLLDDTLLLAARWAAAGNQASTFVAPDLPHSFTGWPCAMTDAWAAARYEWLGSVCSTGRRRG